MILNIYLKSQNKIMVSQLSEVQGNQYQQHVFKSKAVPHITWAKGRQVGTVNREYFTESAGVRYLRTSC